MANGLIMGKDCSLSFWTTKSGVWMKFIFWTLTIQTFRSDPKPYIVLGKCSSQVHVTVSLNICAASGLGQSFNPFFVSIAIQRCNKTVVKSDIYLSPYHRIGGILKGSWEIQQGRRQLFCHGHPDRVHCLTYVTYSLNSKSPSLVCAHW
jgi:hypothetical protein